MVRDPNEYENPESEEAKKILEKTAKKETNNVKPMLHIVDQLPTQEVRHVEKDGQTHEFITIQEAVTTLWNERNKK